MLPTRSSSSTPRRCGACGGSRAAARIRGRRRHSGPDSAVRPSTGRRSKFVRNQWRYRRGVRARAPRRARPRARTGGASSSCARRSDAAAFLAEPGLTATGRGEPCRRGVRSALVGPEARTRSRARCVRGARPTSGTTLVRAMPRPSPFLLHGWLLRVVAPLRGRRRLAVHVAYPRRQARRRAAAVHRRRYGLRVLSFVGGDQSALADLLLADGEGDRRSRPRRARGGGGARLADLFGLPADSRSSRRSAPAACTLVERSRRPCSTSAAAGTRSTREARSKRRNQHRRRRRQLAELGRVERRRRPDRRRARGRARGGVPLHELRWRGRPDGSGLRAHRTGKAFHRAAIAASPSWASPRIVTLKIDGSRSPFTTTSLLEHGSTSTGSPSTRRSPAVRRA